MEKPISKEKNEIVSSGQEFLGKKIVIHFDRPLGTKHPRFDWIYPVNYGFVPGTKAGDGMEIDVYYLSASEPLQDIEGTCIGYVHRLDDNEDKLIATDGAIPTEEEIEAILAFQEQYYKHEIVLSDE